MNTHSHKTLLTAMVIALLLGASTTALADDPCNTKANGKKGRFYDGPSASYVYDDKFDNTDLKIPHLDDQIPQGLATWSDWKGDDDLILISGYDSAPTEASRREGVIIALDAKSGKHVGSVRIDTPHAGGIAVFEDQGYVYVAGPFNAEKKPTILHYALDGLKEGLARDGDPARLGDEPVLGPVGQTVVPAASFLTSHGPTKTLWTGSHNANGKGSMYAYEVQDDGDLKRVEGSWEVPKKTQGLVVKKDLFIFSTSLGRTKRSNIWVVERGKGERVLGDAPFYCFRTPTMSEGIAIYGKSMLVAYESGAAFYVHDPVNGPPKNIIRTLHRVPVKELEDLPIDQ